ncbi:MAG: bacillithiol biosynthesis deacetylase BshB1 [Planctomycetota bacterium]|nr:bacillithiol biosynthesis deacetylase BshB1 [Planctomycetota bacterium]MCX8040791.1 bacillithiol biosynthesis deacetylase BshB1 [Planctomycetota bacterium]MDW8372018.1 bacillithiol biosynthesis deacetylase BshB1 [Planctomycetota bacterium]
MAEILVIAPHPDDAELHAGGLIARHRQAGRSVVIADATAGELGSRGDAAQRLREAAEAARLLGVERECLGLPDGGLSVADREQRAVIVAAIRRHRPRVVIALAEQARHPDHSALAGLVRQAIKAAALHRLPAPGDHPAWDGARLIWVEAELPLQPSALVPLDTACWASKMAAIRCYASQLAGGSGPPTSISRPEFLEWIEARGRVWGQMAGAPYAEAIVGAEPLLIGDLVGS